MKRHYWLVHAKSWNVDHYDEFSMVLDAEHKYITHQAIEDCKKAVSSKNTGYDKGDVIIVSTSYLGHMTAEEFTK